METEGGDDAAMMGDDGTIKNESMNESIIVSSTWRFEQALTQSPVE
jgi:hypothetical protein